VRRLALPALLIVLGICAPVAAQPLDREPIPTFNLSECANLATHILVVDRRGRVVDMWKGHAGVGQTIPLDKILSPALPRQTGVSLDGPITPADLSGYWQDQLQGRERFILFLVKSSTPLPAVPTTTQLDELDSNNESRPPRRCFVVGSWSSEHERDEERRAHAVARDGWLPASRHGWFACSMAYIDDLGLVRTRQLAEPSVGSRFCRYSRLLCNPELVPAWCVAGTEDGFRRQVLEAMVGCGFTCR